MKKKVIIVISILILITLLFVTILFNSVSLKINGDKNIELKLGDKYYEESATACSNKIITCQDISKEIQITGEVDTSKIGTYKIQYKIKHGFLTKAKTRTIKVVDDIAPTITLEGNTEINLCPNEKYQEAGYKVEDNYDDNVIVTIEEVDNKLIYTAVDSSGNEKKVFRTINRVDLEMPTIDIEPTTFIKIYSEYNPTYTAKDNCDGDITGKVVKTGEVDTTKPGSYIINFEVTDAAGNKTSKTQTAYVYQENNKDNVTNKIIYLTFDDGPGPYTEYLLNILKKYDVKATFFVTAQYGYEKVLSRIVNEGHSLGAHSYTHDYNVIYKSETAYFNDLNKIINKIYDNTGYKTNLIRFPGGSSNMVSRFNPGIMTYLTKEVEKRGYVYFDWNIDSKDTSTTDSKEIKNNVISNLGNGTYVVLQHDIKQYSVNAVEGIIQYGIANGYTFLPLNVNSYSAHHHVNN